MLVGGVNFGIQRGEVALWPLVSLIMDMDPLSFLEFWIPALFHSLFLIVWFLVYK
jgi:hypothetical protein